MREKHIIDLAEPIEPRGIDLNQRYPRSRQPLRVAANDSMANHHTTTDASSGDAGEAPPPVGAAGRSR
jgi:hypothetical protein